MTKFQTICFGLIMALLACSKKPHEEEKAKLLLKMEKFNEQYLSLGETIKNTAYDPGRRHNLMTEQAMVKSRMERLKDQIQKIDPEYKGPAQPLIEGEVPKASSGH